MRILYVGATFQGSNGTSWRDGFTQLGHEVRSVDTHAMAPWPTRRDQKILARIRKHPGTDIVRQVNEAITDAAREFRPHLIFHAQGRYVTAETVQVCRTFGPTLVHMIDDMFNPINQSSTFFELVREADLVLTPKSFNVPEFRATGARRVEFIAQSYDPEIHFRAPLTQDEREDFRCSVAFLGTFRPERADFLEEMVRRCPQLETRIWGGWNNMSKLQYRLPVARWPELRRSVRYRELWCAEYSKAIQAASIVLGLLNHANRDLHTARSFEIPACGGFMLAERTDEHCSFFEEDKEAVYFSSMDELVDKLLFYISNELARRKIAEAGYLRCTTSGYQYSDRARHVLGLALGLREASE